MEAYGINLPYLLLQLSLCGLALVVLALPIAAVLQLRNRRDIDDTSRLVWVLIIVFAPIIGAIAFFVYNRRR